MTIEEALNNVETALAQVPASLEVYAVLHDAMCVIRANLPVQDTQTTPNVTLAPATKTEPAILEVNG